MTIDSVNEYEYSYYTTSNYSLLKSKIHIIQPNDTINAISNPHKLLFHNNNSEINIKVYRGEIFIVSVYAVGAVAPTAVSARISNTARLKSNTQLLQNISQEDSILVYNLYSTQDKEELTLHPSGLCSEEGKVIVHVIFNNCPVGFRQSNDECICERRLMKYTTKCIIDEDIFIMRKSGSTFWMNFSYENGTYNGLILYKNCPEEYCKAETVNISLDNPDIQCALNRSRVLCGACVTNHSLMLGSSRCYLSQYLLSSAPPFCCCWNSYCCLPVHLETDSSHWNDKQCDTLCQHCAGK